jgi:AraC-like DNA-binding protein
MIIREQAETISPELLASELNVSYSWFRRSFKDYTGSSPTQYILLIKSQKAKELLANTDLTINEISEKLHYTSPYYFSVSFKRTSGMTPGEFRKMAWGSGL